MINKYKPKVMSIDAEQLEQDAILTPKGSTNPADQIHLQGGTYLIRLEDGKIFPANKYLFEYLFEKEENEEKAEEKNDDQSEL